MGRDSGDDTASMAPRTWKPVGTESIRIESGTRVRYSTSTTCDEDVLIMRWWQTAPFRRLGAVDRTRYGRTGRDDRLKLYTAMRDLDGYSAGCGLCGHECHVLIYRGGEETRHAPSRVEGATSAKAYPTARPYPVGRVRAMKSCVMCKSQRDCGGGDSCFRAVFAVL